MTERFDLRQQLVLLALVYSVSLFLRPEYIFGGDHRQFMSWTESILSLGIPNAYKTGEVNHGVGVVYLLGGFGTLVGNLMPKFHLYLRQFFFLFDLGTIFLLMRYLERNGQSAMRALFVLFNLAFLYNSLLWGQVDGVVTFFVFASILAALVDQPELAAVMLVAAFNVKPQPIIYLPLAGLLLIPFLARHPRRLVTTIAAAIGIQLLVLLPFLENGAWRDWIAVYIINTNLYPLASANAHNIWYLLLVGDPIAISDASTFLSVTYKTWGVLMFGLYGFVVLFPLLIRVGVCTVRRIAYGQNDGELALLTGGMISVGFFFFNTEMHERYSYPAVLFLGAYAVLARTYFLYILVSVAHLLNVNYVFRLTGMSLPLLNDPHAPAFVAGLFLLAVVVGLVQMYRGRGWSNELEVLTSAFRESRRKRTIAAAAGE